MELNLLSRKPASLRGRAQRRRALSERRRPRGPSRGMFDETENSRQESVNDLVESKVIPIL
jgi:hypothetical protein